MRRLELDGVELSLSLVSDAQIRKLNRAWRKKDKATDVLSFPLFSGPRPRGTPLRGGLRSSPPAPLGDVVISLETARRVAKERSVAIATELNLYLAHGLLHLLGHDHHRVEARKRMATAEAHLLGTRGMLTRQ
ncbi:MAG: rRNA maturation RNase YbeY [Myxococcaceae bacterium]|nr:rRNA maturation RNase YbeY [Myxococcaceae bacterium]